MTTRRRTAPTYIGGGAPLTLSVADRADATVVTIVGELDRETGSRLASAVVGVAGQQDRIELDMSGVTFMDSQGLRVLLEAKFAADASSQIVITTASSQVRDLLDMTGLTEAFSLAPDGR